MTTGLHSVFSGEAWSVSGLLFGVDGLFDEDGRPLGERRAPSAAKAQVAMTLEPAPYDDARKGGPMNVSALEQVQRHLKAVQHDVAAFYALEPGRPRSWERMLRAVLDQLSAPLVHVVRSGQPTTRVPAAKAVGYKLAAGYFGALRRLLTAQAHGDARPVTPEAFVDFIHQTRLLVGGNEVCAGPPKLIAHTTEVFLDGLPEVRPTPDAWRLAVATRLAWQVQLGLAWEVFDAAVEAGLLRDLGARLRARTSYLAEALAERRLAIDAAAPYPTLGAARRALPGEGGAPVSAVAEALQAHEAGTLEASCAATVQALATLREGALELDLPTSLELARRFADWLEVCCRVREAQSQLELELRALLHQPTGAPVAPSALMVCSSRPLRWFEAALGHSLVLSPSHAQRGTLRSARRTVPLQG